MQLIRCTAKVQKEMGLETAVLTEDAPKSALLGQWHCNLIYIDRRKCILFANDKTLFNFIVPDVSRAEIRELGEMFKLNLGCVLNAEGFHQDLVAKVLSEYAEIEYGKSNDRRVLGSLNDLAFHYRHWITECGGVRSTEIPAIIQKLNRMPMKRFKEYLWPADEIRKLFQAAS